MTPRLSKVISGGQTGADRAGLDWALKHGFDMGGWCPKGRKSSDGVIPRTYPLKETASDGYPARTKMNVQEADATLIFTGLPMGRGSQLTERCCKEADKPYLVITDTEEIACAAERVFVFMEQHNVAVLNIAGSRYELFGKLVHAVMDPVFDMWVGRFPAPKPAQPQPGDPKKFLLDRRAQLGVVEVQDSRQRINFKDVTGAPLTLRQGTDESVWLGGYQFDRDLAERLAATLLRWTETSSFLSK